MADEGLLPSGTMSEARVPYCLPVKPSWTKMMVWRWGWTPLLHSLSPLLPFHEFRGFCNVGNVYEGLCEVWTEIRSRSHVVSWLLVAAWWWVVSAVLWSFSAGRGVKTTPQGWIYIKDFITAGLYTIHADEMKAWFEKVPKWVNYIFKTEVSGNLSLLFTEKF